MLRHVNYDPTLGVFNNGGGHNNNQDTEIFYDSKKRTNRSERRFGFLYKNWSKWGRKEKEEARERIESAQHEASNLRGSARQVQQLAAEYQHAHEQEFASLLQDKGDLLLAFAAVNDEMADLIEQNTEYARQNASLIRYAGKLESLESQWTKAMQVVGVTEEEIKSVGKLEHDLNKVVGWFTKHYGCQLGVVVEKLA